MHSFSECCVECAKPAKTDERMVAIGVGALGFLIWHWRCWQARQARDNRDMS